MDPLLLGAIVGATLIFLLLTGIPVAFCLGITAMIFIVIDEGFGGFAVLAETLFGSLDEFALLSIPMFLLMGSAIAASRAGSDLYEAIDRWLYKVPGGLLISNIGACGIFAALTGSSPATCAAIGKMGIPEMVDRGYPPSLATGAGDFDPPFDYHDRIWHCYGNIHRATLHGRYAARTHAGSTVHDLGLDICLFERIPFYRFR